MTSQALITTATATLNANAPDTTTFEQLVNWVTEGKAEASARVYRDTYARWATWALDNDLSPLNLHYNTVSTYLAERQVSKGSKQRELAALRTLAEMLAVLDFQNPARRVAYESLKMLKVRSNATQQSDRPRRALSPAEADRLLRVWADDPTPRGLRNQAIISVLLLTGLRRAELVALMWQDVDFENGVITVRHGKGDKARQVAVYGQAALTALSAWKEAQPEGYQHVFVPLRKGGRFGKDKPMTTTDVYRVVSATAEKAGVGHVKPHDLRRTLATELLSNGAPVHDVQAQLGHTNANTTLNNYAVAADARDRRKSGKVRYG